MIDRVPPSRRLAYALAVLIVSVGAVGCAGRSPEPKSPRDVVHMEAMKITAQRTEDGRYVFESYDAEGLFSEATERLNRGACKDAVTGYRRLVREFPESTYASPALYNAGLCLERLEQPADAAATFEELALRMPGSPDVQDAHFQLAKLYVQLERWDDAVAATDWLLARDGLSGDERIEAMARRGQALLGAGKLTPAEDQAKEALSYWRRGSSGGLIHDNTFAAMANFVLAESLRKQAAAIEIPPGGVETQRPILERRAQLILDAQREYFNTIGYKDAGWAAASGYRIGEMYDSFWQAIMRAPVPPPKRDVPESLMPVYREEYRKELARLIEPLTRHAIRYWELTLMMVERTGVDTEWTDKIRADLEQARERMLSQPEPAPGPPDEAGVGSPAGSGEHPTTPSSQAGRGQPEGAGTL